MAAAVSVTRWRAVALDSCDAFERAVVRLLTDRCPAADEGASAGTLPVEVVVSGHPRPKALDDLDRAAFESGGSWLPVVRDPTAVRVGPVLTPPAGPCLRCVEARRDQHDPNHTTRWLIDEAWESGRFAPEPVTRPELVAAVVDAVLEVLNTTTSCQHVIRPVAAGPMLVERYPVVPRQGCGRCHA